MLSMLFLFTRFLAYETAPVQIPEKAINANSNELVNSVKDEVRKVLR